MSRNMLLFLFEELNKDDEKDMLTNKYFHFVTILNNLLGRATQEVQKKFFDIISKEEAN
jgi:hypothetical protein